MSDKSEGGTRSTDSGYFLLVLRSLGEAVLSLNPASRKATQGETHSTIINYLGLVLRSLGGAVLSLDTLE